MAISRTEAAMYAYITGRGLPKGTTRTAFKALVGTAIRGAQLAAPRLAAAYGPALAGTPAALAAARLVPGLAISKPTSKAKAFSKRENVLAILVCC